MLSNPWLSWTRDAKSDSVFMTEQFEFAASHRLHNPDLSDEENLSLYGKCNNRHGHGHNYVIDVTVASESDPAKRLQPESLAAIVKSRVIDRFDHRNLNIEIEEFQRLIPSIENIAIVIWNLLSGELAGTQLANIRVYETPKTWADFSG